MNKKIITLIAVMLSMAFVQNIQAVEWSESGAVEIHGFITQGYIVTDYNNFFADTEDDGTMQFNEIGINFGSDVSERLRLGVQFFARDLGKMGDMELTVDWAVADYSFYDWLNLRAGKIKMPYGLYNSGRDVDLLRTFVFLPQSIYFEGWRDSANALNGAGFYGYIPAGLVGNFEYQAYSGTATISEDGGVARLLQDEMSQQTGFAQTFDITYVDVNTTYVGQLAWDTIFGLDGLKVLGGSWAIDFDSAFDIHVSPNTTISNSINSKLVVYNASAELSVGNLVLAMEYVVNKYDLAIKGQPANKFDAEGYYGSMTYRFLDWLEAGIYYSEYYSDTEDKDGKKAVADGKLAAGMEHNQWSKDLCASLRFDISANWVFKLEGHKMNGSALLYSDDDNMTADGTAIEYKEDWHMVAAKLAFSF